MRDTIGDACLAGVTPGGIDGLRKVQDRGGKPRVRRQEGERVRAAAAADVEQPAAAIELDASGRELCRPERARVLRRAEAFPADPALVDEALVVPLVGKHALAAQRLVEVAHALISDCAVDEPD